MTPKVASVGLCATFCSHAFSAWLLVRRRVCGVAQSTPRLAANGSESSNLLLFSVLSSSTNLSQRVAPGNQVWLWRDVRLLQAAVRDMCPCCLSSMKSREIERARSMHPLQNASD